MSDDPIFQKDTNPVELLNISRWRAGFVNVVDETAHENSPYRNRPAYLDQDQELSPPNLGIKKDWNAVAPVHPPKDWNTVVPAHPPKDWSKLGR